MDYRSLNEYIKSSPGLDSAVCDEKLREWRRLGTAIKLLDLRKAYLQIYIDSSLWCYQVVNFNGKRYVMTRLGFGLNIGPKVMTKVLDLVLEKCNVKEAVDHYIDDIVIDTDRINVTELQKLLNSYGLSTKEPEQLDGARVLGLRVTDNGGRYQWSRDGSLPVIPNELSKRELYSICGQWLGHFPVAGWLRVVCNWLRRESCDESAGTGWDSIVNPDIHRAVENISNRLLTDDPVRGVWSVEGKRGIVWTDASNTALGVVVTIDDVVVEDGSWLRKKQDSAHVNVAELDAAIKGINMGIKWKLEEIELVTDSSTVKGWLSNIVNKTHRPRTHGMSEMIIRRRLDVLKELTETYAMKVTVKLVPSQKNLADKMTRIPSDFMKEFHCAMCFSGTSDVVNQLHHETGHLGVDRTQELLEAKGKSVPRSVVNEVIKRCNRCNRIDPAPRERWSKGKLSCDQVWLRLATDITYVSRQPYLTVVDCASRFNIWRRLAGESATSVTAALESIFSEFGPPRVLLFDNSPTFLSAIVARFLSKWAVIPMQCCAYRHQGNGIVERAHRTIKRMVERSEKCVSEMVFWYNATTNSVTGEAPFVSVFGSVPKLPTVTDSRRVRASNIQQEWADEVEDTISNPLQVGDSVYLKPRQPSCTSHWSGPFQVSRVPNNWSVDLGDGIHRHVSHVRRVCDDDNDHNADEQKDGDEDNGDCADDSGPGTSSRVSDDDVSSAELEHSSDHGEWSGRLRDRSSLQPPLRYRE